jgi:hypothetical protein
MDRWPCGAFHGSFWHVGLCYDSSLQSMKKTKTPRKSSGLPEGPSSTSSPSVPDQGPDVPPQPEIPAICPDCGHLIGDTSHFCPGPERDSGHWSKKGEDGAKRLIKAFSSTVSEADMAAINESGDISTDFQALTREIAKEAVKQVLPVETLWKESASPPSHDFNYSPLSESEAREGGLSEKLVQAYKELEKPSLAQSVLSRLSTKLPSSAPVVPRGVPIQKSGKPKGPSKTRSSE